MASLSRLWNSPVSAFVLGTAVGALGLLAVRDLPLPALRLPFGSTPAPVVAAQAPDALGASLARSLAEAGYRVLAAGPNAAGRAGCDAAITGADAAALRAAEDARGRARNQQDRQLVLSAEDAYLDAARLCIRQAREICRAAGARRPEGCEPVLGVSDQALASTSALRVGRGP